jgi:hypothetical protein
VRDEERRVVTETEPPQTSELEERSKEHSSSIPTRAAVLAAAVLLGIIVYGYLDMPGSGWIGVANKKFWNYLDLLIVPAALALGVYWLNRRQNERDQQAEKTQRERELEVENRRAQDAALQTYLDQMSQLLADTRRPLHEAKPGDSLSTVARARTLTVLSGLGRDRKRSVAQFLYESGLIKKNTLVIQLHGAYLSGVDLRGAIPRYATLREAGWSNATLSEVVLSWANLSGANLSREDLSGADLQGADLSSASGITNEDLKRQTFRLEGAPMPNGQKYEDWLKSKGCGEDGQNSDPSSPVSTSF